VAKFIIDVLAGVSLIVFWIKWDLNVIIQAICFKFERACFYSMEMGGLYILTRMTAKLKAFISAFFPCSFS
jgi:hypothetical protein